MRIVVLAVLLALAAAPSAFAQVRLGASTVEALAGAEGLAYVVLDTNSTTKPFKVVRSSGAGVTPFGTYGERKGGDPAIAAGAAGALIGWTVPLSGGLSVVGQLLHASRPQQLAVGTGTSALAVADDGAVVAAYPDEAGDTEVSVLPCVLKPPRECGPYDLPTRERLSADAPERRHRPLAVAAPATGPFVLDLVQTRTRTTLDVAGDRAPAGPVTVRGGLHALRATLAADAETVAVAYAARGRVRLATAAPGGNWHTRTFGSGVAGTPAVAMDGGRPTVVWSSRPHRGAGRELYRWSGGATRRITHSTGDDGQPFAASRGSGGIFVAWTRHDGRRDTALLQRFD